LPETPPDEITEVTGKNSVAFTKSFNNITIDETTPSYICDTYVDTFVNICTGAVERLKYILTKTEFAKDRNFMIKEVMMTLMVADSMSLISRKGTAEILYIKLGELKNKVVKFGKKCKHKFGGLFEPAITEMLERTENKELLKQNINTINKDIGPLDGCKVDLMAGLENFMERLEIKRKIYKKGFSDKRQIQERLITKPFYYEIGNQREITQAYTWKTLAKKWREQAKMINQILKWNQSTP
jgi:hypothetical protein